MLAYLRGQSQQLLALPRLVVTVCPATRRTPSAVLRQVIWQTPDINIVCCLLPAAYFDVLRRPLLTLMFSLHPTSRYVTFTVIVMIDQSVAVARDPAWIQRRRTEFTTNF